MSQPLAASLGATLREARTRAGLTQAQVAEALRLPLPAYARMERGRLMPGLTTFVHLAQVLDTSPDALLRPCRS
jgi:transcriptional regulator with XRE-family HTH domain